MRRPRSSGYRAGSVAGCGAPPAADRIGPAPGGVHAAPAGRVGITSDDRQLLRPVAARLRFLVLSEPFRQRTPNGGAWLPRYAAEPRPTERVFGTDLEYLFVAACRQARWDWQRHVDEYQSHPVLASGSARELEQA